ncbi:MAG: tryptophan 7-halogenase [Planctomycetes bacterium]|nr:tryptophan 7-halogenase [Planctomycetota bacterium]
MSDPMQEVVVIGGGPAGATVATLVQRAGHHCVLLERETFPRYHVGESLIPGANRVLDRLGLLGRMKTSTFTKKHSVRFVSRSGSESFPFYFGENIQGDRSRVWQVERSEFDRFLLENASAAGVDVRQNAFVEEVLFDGDRAVGVCVRTDGHTATLGARVIVDASGRATVLGRQLGLRSAVPGLTKAANWGYYRGGERIGGIDAGETTVFLRPGGAWLWYLPLPRDRVSVGIVADATRLTGRAPEKLVSVHEQAIAECETLARRLGRAVRLDPVRSLPLLAYYNRRTVGNGWVMVGDARGFLDPIFSYGVSFALSSAELTADTIFDALESDDVSASSLGRLDRRLSGGFEVLRRLIHAMYDERFTFDAFFERFPQHRQAVFDCLTGDVLFQDFHDFTSALADTTPHLVPLD